MERHTEAVASHYDQGDIATAIGAKLAANGLDAARLTIDDFAQMDEVHTRGREATIELAGLTEIRADMDLIDVGSGVGGPARYLATTFGCRVEGVDLTPAFVGAARYLTDLLQLNDKVRFSNASALDLPFPEARFDLAWTVQMQMNIADKAALYGEIYRVLKPGGRLLFQDIVRGPTGEIVTPVPWASAPEHSHLVPPEGLRDAIIGAGFTEIAWRDITEVQRAWVRAQAAQPAAEPPALGIELVLGPDTKTKRGNAIAALMDGAIGFVQGVYAKPS